MKPKINKEDMDNIYKKDMLGHRVFSGGILPVPVTESGDLVERESYGLEGRSSAYETFEKNMDPERFVDREFYARGGHSIIYKATDSKTGSVVALKRHLHFIPSEREVVDAKEIREAEKRFKSDAMALGRLNHPGIIDAYGYFITEEKGETVPYLVMKLELGDSLERQIQRGEVSSEEDVRRVILSVGSILDFMHNENGKPIIYRDLKAGNLIVMPGDAEWPHKLVDFSESKLGNATFYSGSVLGSPGYSSPEQWGGGEAGTTSDFYSLARIGIGMAIQDEEKFRKNWLDIVSLREIHQDGDLDVSEQLLGVLEKATEREVENRYSGFVEMARDLGYDIERAPKTREELEGILGNRSNLSTVIGSSSKSLDRTGGQDAYTFLTTIHEDEGLTDEEKSKRIVSYVAERSEAGDVFFQRVSEGERPEGIVREAIGKGWKTLINRTAKQEYRTVEQEYREARKSLRGVFEGEDIVRSFGYNNYSSNGWVWGMVPGIVLTSYSAIINNIESGVGGLGMILLGAALGDNMERILPRRKSRKQLLSQARELGGILKEAGVFPEESTAVQSVGGLEEKVKSGELLLRLGMGVVTAGATGAGLVGAGATGGVGLVVAGGAGLLGVGGAAVGAGAVAETIGLPEEEQDYHARKGLLYGTIGAAANISQAIFLDISVEQKILLGGAIQATATLIEPAKIIGKHYLAKRKERKLEAPETEEKGLVGRTREWIDNRTLRRGWEGEREIDLGKFYAYEDLHKYLESSTGLELKKPLGKKKFKGEDFEIVFLGLQPGGHIYDSSISWNGQLRIKAKTQEQSDNLAKRILSEEDDGTIYIGGGPAP